MAVLRDSIVNGDLIVTGKIEGYLKKGDIGTVIKYAGTVNYKKDLPSLESSDIGTVYIIKYHGDSGAESLNEEVIWSYEEGSSGAMKWESLGNDSSLSGYYSKSETYNKSEIDTFLGQKVSNDVFNEAISKRVSKDDFGFAKAGTNIDVSDGTISVKTATNDNLGLVKVGDNIGISSGEISVTKLSLGNSSETTTLITAENNGINPTVKITGKKNTDNTDPTSSSCALSVDGDIFSSNYISASKVFHAVWNDISDAIEVQDDLDIIPGACYVFDGKSYKKSETYCQKGIIGIHSDTAGDILGRKGKHKELDIAIGGFVLAFVDGEYESGTPLTCSVDGYLTAMTREDVREYPERLIATYWKPETEKLWGSEDHKVEVNGRHWVKIK